MNALDALFATTLDCAGRRLVLDRPRVVGIVNVTPDSFSDGGQHASTQAAVAHGLRLAEEGADMLDIGGESTRPGVDDVAADEELARVVPVIEQLAARTPLPIAVDTSKPEVMRAAVAAGAGMVNDVYALRREGALETVAELGVPVCLMHMQGEPATMQQAPVYQEVVSEVEEFLQARVQALLAAGIARERIVIDPGIGFGKTTRHNLALLAALDELSTLGQPVLLGVSRKSLIGELTGRAVEQRLAGSLAAMLAGVARGAAIVRVHDVAATRDALAVWQAIENA